MGQTRSLIRPLRLSFLGHFIDGSYFSLRSRHCRNRFASRVHGRTATHASSMNRAAPGTECRLGSLVYDLRLLDSLNGQRSRRWFHCRNSRSRPFRSRSLYRGCTRCRFFPRRRGRICSPRNGRHLTPELQQFTMQRIIALIVRLRQLQQLLLEFALPP